MNKDLIKKYWKEFDYWLDGGELLWHYAAGWETLTGWGLPDETLIIINDEYVEFRKALAEGKTIQYKHYSDESFSDLENFPFADGYDYRIKPDEPEFKIGDYVVNKAGTKHIEQVLEIIDSSTFLTQGDIDDSEYHGQCSSSVSGFKLWTLEEADDDEWVLAWIDGTEKSYGLMQVKELIGYRYDNVVPYIGQSPEQLGLEK